MNRYIDADWIVQELEWWRDKLAETHGENDEYVLCLGEVLMKLDDVPTADVRENAKGEWIRRDSRYVGWISFDCSVCGETLELDRETSSDFKYCPFCGADMRGEA